MKCSVTFRHMKASEAVRAFVEDKMEKLGRLVDHGGEASVVVAVEKRFHVVHIDLITAGAHRIRADERGEDMYAAIDAAVEKLLTQLRRFKEKARDHHRLEGQRGRELSHQILRAPRDEAADALEPAKRTIVRQERIVASEMAVDDALQQMDLLNSDFLVFTDRESNQLNVMYRLPDGDFGLIEAHRAS